MDVFRGKKVTVLGLARSGEAAAILLDNLGARVLVSDMKHEKELRESVSRIASAHPNIRFALGGHADAIVEDADLVVVSPGVPSDIPIVERARKRNVPVIGEVELAYRVCRAPIVAITGTKGKSTTSTLLGQILSKSRKGKTVVAGNIGEAFSQYVLELTESDLLVLEVSSFQLDTTVHFAPEVAVILNIMRDHFDRHSSMEEYAAAKYRIFANQTGDNYTVLNADDPLTMACASRTKAKVILFSGRQNLDEGVCVENGEIVAKHDGSTTKIMKSDELKIPGRHNLENALAATAVSLVYGVAPETIGAVFRSFPGLKHALEVVDEIHEVKFVNDSKATNVGSLRAALESFAGNVILIMGGRDKGNDYNPLEKLVQEKVKHLILIGESAKEIRGYIGGYSETHQAETMEGAVRLAYSLASPGDTVLLSPACASFDMFRNYAHRGEVFIEAVKEIAEAEK